MYIKTKLHLIVEKGERKMQRKDLKAVHAILHLFCTYLFSQLQIAVLKTRVRSNKGDRNG